MSIARRNIPFFTLLLAVSWRGTAQPAAQPETQAQRDERMQWWRDARFGMFVHWGLLLGIGGDLGRQAVAPAAAWNGFSSASRPIPGLTRHAPSRFRPKPGFAREWARSETGRLQMHRLYNQASRWLCATIQGQRLTWLRF